MSLDYSGYILLTYRDYRYSADLKIDPTIISTENLYDPDHQI